MQFSTKILGLGLACTLAVVGCGKKDKETKEQPAAAETPVVTEVTPNCDDASVKNALVRALAGQIDGHINTAMANYPDAESLDLIRRTQQRLSTLSIDLQNAKVEGEVCHIDVIVHLPTVDITYADRYFASVNAPRLSERASELGVNLDDGGRLSIPVSYKVTDGVVDLTEPVPALSIISDAISASAYVMAKGGGRVNTAHRPTVTVHPLQPTEIVRPQPVPRPDAAPAPTAQTAEPSISISRPESQDPLAAQYAEQNSSEATSPATTPAPEAAPAPAATPAPTATPAPAARPSTRAPQGDDEITIVETDETY